MTKSKDRSEVETLKGIIRAQKSEIKNLKKQLSRFNKRAHQYEDLEEKLKDIGIEEHIEEVLINRCPKCKGVLSEVDLGVRKLIKCDSCGHRESKKNG